MRDNQPVTDRESVLPDGQYLVSATDPRGVIRFANQAFVDISGYTRQELVGQPHNLVRHPDMPAAAFADLWATLQARQSWIGVVKNRRKDGGFYWVRAAVSPVIENGQLTGYISVRRKPTAAEVATAGAAYARITASDGAWTVARGRLRRTGLAARISRGLAPLSRRVALTVVLLIAVMVGGLGAGLTGLREANRALADLTADELGTAVNMQHLQQTYHACWEHLVLASRPDADVSAEIIQARAARDEVGRLINVSKNLEMDPAETAFNNELRKRSQAFFDEVVDPAIALAEAGKRGALAVLVTSKGLELMHPLDGIASEQTRLQLTQATSFVAARDGEYRVFFGLSAALTALAVLIGMLTAWLVPRAIRRSADGLRSGMEDLARGQMDAVIDLDRSDEFGPVNLAYAALQTQIAYQRSSGSEMRSDVLREFDASIGSVVGDLARAVSALKASAQAQGGAATELAGSAQTVAASASEMSASIKEIAAQATQASTLARAASGRADGSREAMAKLSKAAQEITAVAKLIADIAEQTNLLALNATIEAARAGEVGRGFAVVAGEVKSLANQTQGATGDINRKIAAVQADTEAAVAALAELTTGIGQLDDAAHAIAAAVEEQSAVTEEIARNAEQSAAGARRTGDSARDVAAAADALAGTDAVLEKAVARFKSGSAG